EAAVAQAPPGAMAENTRYFLSQTGRNIADAFNPDAAAGAVELGGLQAQLAELVTRRGTADQIADVQRRIKAAQQTPFMQEWERTDGALSAAKLAGSRPIEAARDLALPSMVATAKNAKTVGVTAASGAGMGAMAGGLPGAAA